MQEHPTPKFHKVKTVIVDMEPIPWSRTGLAPVKNFQGDLVGVRPFTPKKQRQGRDNFLKAILSDKPRRFIDGALGLEIKAFLRIPKSWPKYKKREAIQTIIRPVGSPDWDNYGKFISDALESHFYKNDSAIVGAGVALFYSDRPRWEISIYKWGI